MAPHGSARVGVWTNQVGDKSTWWLVNCFKGAVVHLDNQWRFAAGQHNSFHTTHSFWERLNRFLLLLQPQSSCFMSCFGVRLESSLPELAREKVVKRCIQRVGLRTCNWKLAGLVFQIIFREVRLFHTAGSFEICALTQQRWPSINPSCDKVVIAVILPSTDDLYVHLMRL
jgi:hypothetical protein